MFKLGVPCVDSVTGLKGMLTHMQLDTSEQVWYNFQPNGLNPKTKEPVDSFWIDPARVSNCISTTASLPLEILGTEVEDTASGFKGIVINLVYHINGCVHADVQSKGTLPDSGNKINAVNFDVRRLKGKAIKKLSEKEIDSSTKEKPSPSLVRSYKPG